MGSDIDKIFLLIGDKDLGFSLKKIYILYIQYIIEISLNYSLNMKGKLLFIVAACWAAIYQKHRRA